MLPAVRTDQKWQAVRFAYNWTPGFSWWLTDGGGNWHVATAGEPWTFGDGTQAFRLRLTPPLTAIPDMAELVLTGPSTRARVGFPVPADQLAHGIGEPNRIMLPSGSMRTPSCWPHSVSSGERTSAPAASQARASASASSTKR